MKNIVCLFSIVSILLPGLWNCGNNKQSITGSWQSVSIENPAPLFKKTLPNRKVGSIKLTIDSNGDFSWADVDNGPRITGTCHMEKGALLLTSVDDKETVPVRYTVSEKRLILKTDDGFTFVFDKIPDNN